MNKLALWFHDQGIGVFPIVDKGKEPACKWADFSCHRDTAAAFNNYGVRLGRGIGVIDTDSPESEEFIASEIAAGLIPETPFQVKTARGLHRYYRLGGPTPKFIRRNGMPIEFRNEGQYVVGPSSLHPSGCVYTPSDWSWVEADIPIFPTTYRFNDGTCGVRSEDQQHIGYYEFPDSVTAGERHHELFKLTRSLKAIGGGINGIEAVWWCVCEANANKCVPPLPMNGLRRWFDRGWNNPDREMDHAKHLQIEPVIDKAANEALFELE